MNNVVLTTGAIDVAAELTRVPTCTCCGAVLWFCGNVRETNAGRRVTAITYSAYEAMARQELESIIAEARSRWPIHQCVVIHRLGTLGLGETSLLVGTSAPHRADAYAAQQWVIDELKRRVPIWKDEHYCDGQRQWL